MIAFTMRDQAFQGYLVPKPKLPGMMQIIQAERWADRAFKEYSRHCWANAWESAAWVCFEFETLENSGVSSCEIDSIVTMKG